MKRVVVTALTVALLALPAAASTVAAATPKCGGFKATHVGNGKANIIYGSAKRDVIVARGGQDKIYGRGGNDIICAGAGKDIVVGGAGNDKIFGGDGNDKLKGGAGYDRLDGGPKVDGCWVNAGGGKTLRCEEADLRVTVTGDDTVTSGDLVRFDILLKNVGGKPAASVELELERGVENVSCLANTESFDFGQLKPGAFEKQFDEVNCSIDSESPRTVTMTATATTTSVEDVTANNIAEKTTEVLPKP